jgi:hypothetical protein
MQVVTVRVLASDLVARGSGVASHCRYAALPRRVALTSLSNALWPTPKPED